MALPLSPPLEIPQFNPPSLDPNIDKSPEAPISILGQGGPTGTDPTIIGQSSDSWVDVDEGQLTEIADWLVTAIDRSVTAKQTLDDQLVIWEKQYEAIPKTPVKNWPWPNASNLVVPITASHVESVLARLMGSIFMGRQLWVGEPKSAKWVDLVEPIEQWLNWVGHDVMDMYTACQQWFLGMLKFGTGILKLPWEKIVRRVVYKETAGTTKTEIVVRHEGPLPVIVPISDFYVTPDAYSTLDVQNCEGIFQRCVWTKKTLKERESSGIFRNLDKILDSPRSQDTPMQEQKNRETYLEIADKTGEFETWEGWVSYDLKGDGILSELLVDYHYPTRTVLRAIYNPYRHQERPFHFIRFMPREGSFWGIGICQMLHDIQEEITSEHNLRVDNASISNSSAFKVKRNSHLDEVEIYPGAFVPFDDVDDIAPLEIGTTHDTLLREELHTGSIGERRTGVSDYSVGRESAAIGSRATATSTLALIREGNKRFLMTINDIRKSLSNIAHQIIMLYQQFAKDNQVMYEIFSEKEKMWIEKYFNMPSEYTKANIAIDVPALSETENKDAKKQGLLTLMQMMNTFYQAIFQAVGAAISPQAPPAIKELGSQAAKAGTEMWKRVLEAFEFRDAETFAPTIEDILMMQSSGMVPNEGGTNGAVGSGNTGPSGDSSGGPPMGPSSPAPQGGAAGLIEQMLASRGQPEPNRGSPIQGQS